MKRLLIVTLLLSGCAVAVAHNMPKFQAATWDFQRVDGPTISVIIDPNGNMTVLEDNNYLGQRYEACRVLDD